MSSVIYVVPWAICDTESIYVKKVKGDDVQVPEKGSEFNSWCIRNVIASPDRMLGQPASLMIEGYKSYETAICKMEARDFKSEFDVSVINTGTKETAAVNCPIHTIWFDEQFMLCNGLSQTSTYEEILAAMGKPDEEKKISSMKDLYYEYGTCTIIFSFRDTYTGMEGKACDRIWMTID